MSTTQRPSSGDVIGSGSGVIEVYVRELDQFFESFDPSPFHEKSLHRDAHEYIVSTAKELSGRVPTALVVYLSRAAGLPDEAAVLGNAIRAYFARRADLMRVELRRVLRRELVNLCIGLTLLVVSVVIGELLTRHLGGSPVAEVLTQSLLIGGWVAMWRPMDFFLYEFWAKRSNLRVYKRLAAIKVRVVYQQTNEARVQLPQKSQVDERQDEYTVRLFDEATGRELGRISEAELKVLQDALEEEGPDDDDYWINPDEIDDLERRPGATPHLIQLLRSAVGDNPNGMDIAFQREGELVQNFRPQRVRS